MQKQANIQDTFLNQARKEKYLLTVFLMNGVQFKGYVRGFDSFTVVMEVEGRQRLVYKHALSTIVPDRNIDISLAEEF